MLRRVFPHPVLSLGLFGLWVLMVNHPHLGNLVMAAIVATSVPLITSVWWPDRPPIRNLPAMIAYAVLVMWDVVLANLQVAKIILFRRNEDIRSAWITVPLDLRTPEAIAVLAGTITMTPGTVTADMSADGRALLIHSLHAPDPDAIRDEIKSRYEARLKRIFE